MADEEARQLPVVIDAATVQAFGSTTWMTDAGPLDVLQSLPVAGGSREYEKLDERAVEVVLSGTSVRVAALRDIIDSKTHANRPKDHEALNELHEMARRRDPGNEDESDES